jgi:hypothetical protein
VIHGFVQEHRDMVVVSALTVGVDRPAAETVIARIVAMVEQASTTRAATQLFIEKIEQLMEQLGRATRVAFDKAGTLTQGTPHLVRAAITSLWSPKTDSAWVATARAATGPPGGRPGIGQLTHGGRRGDRVDRQHLGQRVRHPGGCLVAGGSNHGCRVRCRVMGAGWGHIRWAIGSMNR